jgi:hypothetical protein
MSIDTSVDVPDDRRYAVVKENWASIRKKSEAGSEGRKEGRKERTYRDSKSLFGQQLDSSRTKILGDLKKTKQKYLMKYLSTF